MKKFSDYIVNHTKGIILCSLVLLVFSFIGIKLTRINYDILVYLPEDIETIKGQNILTDDFGMGSYSIVVMENMNSKNVINMKEDIKDVEGVNQVLSIYDVIGTSIPIDMLPKEIVSKLHNDKYDIMFVTFDDSTSSERTIDAVKEIREKADSNIKLGGMSSMVLDTMELSEKEIAIYIIIAVILCFIVLELSLGSFVGTAILLGNIGLAILFNLGTNVFLGEISYITKALVAVLQLGVTTDFSIFLYHSYLHKKEKTKDKNKAMSEAIRETFTSVTGSSLTTIAGFLVLITMNLTLGKDLGIVMAKGVLIGVISVLTLYPALLLTFDKWVTKTSHKTFVPNFSKLNEIIVKSHKAIFVLFLILLIPLYLAYKNVDVYYKIDKTLPDNLDSIYSNKILATDFNIVSPEIILLDKNIKADDVNNLINEIKEIDGIDFIISYSNLKDSGITKSMLSDEVLSIFESDNYQAMLINSTYEVASDELNNQVEEINKIIKKYDKNGILAGEGPLMKDLIKISDEDFKNVNYSSIICILIILFIVLKNFSLPILLITTILFAIFMNMGISYFGGVTLPFVAPIVLGTIQLGATIDYAILLTTGYLNKRSEGIEKRQAIKDTLDYSGNSIFVSGLCFFAATFGVGVYSELEMVGSLCTLISRGAVISMLVVICVLPSILLIFDKLIMKTKLSLRSDKMKKNVKKNVLAAVVFTTMFMGLNNLQALSKNETVYAKLHNDGSIKNIVVSERLINDEKSEELTLYNELENIMNVNSNHKYKIKDNYLTWEAKGSNILYEGILNKNLPVGVKVKYKLNNESISLKDLLGKSGHVEMTLEYENYDKHTIKINNRYETMYTPFTVLMASVIDNSKCENISINNGKIIDNGKSSVIVGISMPGMYDSLGVNELKNLDKIIISFDIKDFTLPSIYNVITPDIIKTDDIKSFSNLNGIIENVNALSENMNKLVEGADKLSEGSNYLKKSLELALKTLTNNNGDVLSENDKINIQTEAVNQVINSLDESYINGIKESTWNTVKNSLNADDPNVNLVATNAGTNIIIDYLKNVNLYNDYVICMEANASGNMTSEAINSCALVNNDTVLPVLQESVTRNLKEAISKTSYYTAENVSKNVAGTLSVEVAKTTASNLSYTLASNVANQVKDAIINTIGDNLYALYDGVSDLDQGVSTLTDGLNKYNDEGISKISGLVNDDLASATGRIESLVNLGENYKSVMSENTIGEAKTKFVYVIDGEKEKISKSVKTSNSSKDTLWKRIKDLFK